MSHNRVLHFKIEKLDSLERLIEDKTLSLVDGSINVGTGGYRRKCSFTLAEALPVEWQSYRWRIYYGYSESQNIEPVYFSQGIFIPVNPAEDEFEGAKAVNYQGVDKTKLFDDYEIDEPITFEAPMSVRDIIIQVAGWFSEQKLNLSPGLGDIEINRTFEEGTTAKTILDTIMSGFGNEWFYDNNGILVARPLTNPADRPTKHIMDSADASIYLKSSLDVDDGNYYNKVTVVGGTTDTPIYRATVQDTNAIALAGGRVVQRYFTIDAAVTQNMVDGRAAYYLSNGVQLPTTLKLDSLVIPTLEVGDIISKDDIRYEVRSFNIPLGLGSQSIEAGKVVE